MIRYIIKRILFFIPVLFSIVLLSFILLHFSPGDPVERLLSGKSNDELSGNGYDMRTAALLRQRLGLDLPLFYFSLGSSNDEENFHSWKKYIPAISLHGNNQFHKWLFGSEYERGLINGNLGHSWVTSESISGMIAPKLFWSVLLTFFSVLLAYLISIPAGIRSALNPHSRFTRNINHFFIILFSLPGFWVATLLMLLLCNPQMINVLPSSGVAPSGGYPPDSGIISRIIHSIPYLVLPTICYTYSSLAFLSNHVRVSIENVLRQDYVRTAVAKGLPHRTVIYKHVLRNALLPMITIFSGIFPLAIGGSVILETVFSIPGMGLLIYNSISSQDYPVIITVFLLTGIVTLSAFLLADVLYALIDPRISYTGRR